jgi:glycosyltransferase involved in cell wall biosynthesis
MLPDIYYGIAAYNEENGIRDCLDSLAEQDLDARTETLICLNGCTDKTEDIVLDAKNRYPQLNIKSVHSRKGKVFAQNEIVRNVKNRQVPLTFIDADVVLDNKCVNTLYDEMHQLDNLIIVGAWPVPYKPEEMSAWERFLYKTLHVRAFYPESEVSVNDVSEYKKYAQERPQKAISSQFEHKSKIYFHGRTFMIRNADFFYIPEKENITDDTFLPNMIHTKFGPGTIRTRYDAIVYYKPYLSLGQHFKTYRRIYTDLANIDENFKEFEHSRKMEKTKTDWNFIFSKGPVVSGNFIMHLLISNAEELCYRVLPRKNISEIWQYEKK